jgi:hypothetical protein
VLKLELWIAENFLYNISRDYYYRNKVGLLEIAFL